MSVTSAADREPSIASAAWASLDQRHHDVAPDVVIAVLQRPQRRLVEGAGPEVDVERQLEGPLGRRGERLARASRSRVIDVGDRGGLRSRRFT